MHLAVRLLALRYRLRLRFLHNIHHILRGLRGNPPGPIRKPHIGCLLRSHSEYQASPFDTDFEVPHE
ncbi:hypothetical protein D9M68_644270 [compost metagenome]